MGPTGLNWFLLWCTKTANGAQLAEYHLIHSEFLSDLQWGKSYLYRQFLADRWVLLIQNVLVTMLVCRPPLVFFLLSQVDIFSLFLTETMYWKKTLPLIATPPPFLFLIPFRKFGQRYLCKATAAARAELPSPTNACWVFSCFHNPPNSDMDYMQDL